MERMVSLKASAGSGKTFSLAVRYLSLLYKGAEPSEILAVTFTNKAANEMKERIVRYLRRLPEEKDFLVQLSKASEIDEEELLARRGEVLGRFLRSDVRITTIDAFLQSVVRKFGYMAKIEPDFAIESLDDGALWEEFLSAVEEAGRYDELLRYARYHGDIYPYLKILFEKEKELPASFAPQATSFLAELQKYEALQERILPLLEDCSKQARDLVGKRPEDFLSSGRVDTILANGTLQYPRSIFNKCHSAQLKTLFFEMLGAAKAYLLAKEANALAAMARFYGLYKSTRQKALDAANALDFKDVEHAAYDLLAEERLDRDFLYFRLDTKIRHILIDEFQDTSITQWRIFEPLVDEIKATDDFRTFFYVGDTKQAIYRFRGGASGLFDAVFEILEPFGMVQCSLRTNYRSKREIVNFVNELFTLEENCKKKGGYVEVVQNPCIESRGAYPKHDWQENLEAAVRKLLEAGAAPSDIAVLIYTNQTILDVADRLAEMGLKAVTTTRRQVIHQPKARALIELLKAIHKQEGGRLHRANFLTFVGLPHDAPLPESLNDPSRHPAHLLKEAMERYDLWDASSLALLEHSLNYETLLDFVEEIETFDKELPPEAVEGVQVLTIHKAKGLEFPHVIVLDGTFDDNPDTLIFGYEGLELSQLRIKTPNLEKLDDAYAAALENERRLIREDAQNKEYVAYTRAESSLLILKNEKKSALLKLEAASLALPYERGELSITPAPPPPPNPEPYENPRQDFGKQGYIKPREYTPNDYEAIYLGLAVHALFEMEGNDYARNRYGALCDYDKALKLYDAARTQPEYRELVAQGRLHREYPFTYQGQAGYIDLLIEHDDALVVVDYKSATPHDPSGYEKQVRHYMETMRTLKGKPCRGYLFYLDTLKLQEVA